MKHTEFEKLVKSFEGSLSLSEEREVSEHLHECGECRRLEQKLKAFFRYAAAGQSARVSQADTARLLNVFQPDNHSSRKKVSARDESFVQRLIANLVFDDWQTALNERFVPGDAATRHLLYRAGELEIDMRFEFDGGEKCRVSGQIFPDCGEKATAEIFSETAASETVFLNDYCEFVFPPVAEGIYHFRFNLAGKTIEIEDISLLS